MKKTILILMCMILLVSTISAWGNVKSVSNTHDKWGYPEVTIKDSWNIPFLRSDLSKVKLEYHDPECLTDCYSKPHIEIYEDSAIIEDIRFMDGKGNLVDRDYEIKLNGERYEINSVLAKGIYNPEIFVKKHINEKLDYQLKINGKWVDELAWWNVNWRYHRNITLTTTVDSENELIENINVTGLSLSTNNCDELRIVNSTGSEIPYNVTNSAGQAVGDGLEWCVIRITYEDLNVGSPLNYSAYYGNALATKPSYIRRGGEHYDNSNVLQLMRLNDANAVKGENAGSSGVPTYVAGAGKFDNAMESDNNDDGLFWNPANFHDINATAGTVEFWYNYSNAGGDVYLWDNENPRIALYYSGGSLHYLTSGDDSIVFSFTNGQLYHLAFNWDMNLNVKRLYVDGAQVMNTSLGYSVATYENYTTGNMSLARRYTLEGGDYVSKWGRYDEMMVSNIFKTSFIGKNVTYIIGEQDELTGATATLNSPVDYYNSTSNDIAFNCSGNDDVGVLNITLIIDGVDNYTITNSTPNSNLTLEQTIGISDGSHNWTCRASDGTGEQGDPNTASIRFFTVDTTPPNYNFTQLGTIDYHIAGNNLTINWTVNDTNLDSCIFEYAGVNKTVTCSANGTYINTTSYSNRNVTLWANDTFGLAASKTMGWDYYVFQNSVNYSASTIEGLNENFGINFTKSSSFSVSQIELIYNGTSYTSTVSQSGNEIMGSNTILIPDFSSSTNVSFNWNVTFSDSSVINTTLYNQSVSVLAGGNCTAYTNNIFNFTIVDEEFQTKLSNTSLEYFFDLYDSTGTSRILNFSGNSSLNPVSICLNVNLSTNSYLLDSIEKYTSEGYATEYYNIVGFTLSSSTLFQNIILYDLNLNDSTDFKITFQGNDFLPLSNALIYIDRQYIPDGNIFRTVELPKTDANGETIGHFVRNDIYYNIRVISNGILVGNFPNVIAYCEDFSIGNCVIDLAATTTNQTTYNYNSELGIIFSQIPSFDNNTRLVSTSFLTDTGESKTITLTVTRSDIFGNNSVCNSSLTSSSGTVSCTVPPGISDTNLITKVYVNGKLATLKNINISSPPYDSIGYIIWFLLTLMFILLFAEDKTMIFVGLVFSYIGAVAMAITKGSITGLGSAGIWIITISVIGIWRLNKENQQ